MANEQNAKRLAKLEKLGIATGSNGRPSAKALAGFSGVVLLHTQHKPGTGIGAIKHNAIVDRALADGIVDSSGRPYISFDAAAAAMDKALSADSLYRNKDGRVTTAQARAHIASHLVALGKLPAQFEPRKTAPKATDSSNTDSDTPSVPVSEAESLVSHG